MILLAFLILTLPTVYELIDDRHGENARDKKKDIYRRAGLMVFASLLSVFLHHITFTITDGILHQGLHIHDTFSNLLLMFGKALAMSFAIFFLTFDYSIAAILIHRGVIETKESAFSYVGKTSKFDKFKLWVRIGPWGRFAVKLAVFVVALIIYF